MRNLILSYDYELFFGEKSGTVENTLIKPTNLLLDAMEEVGAAGNFFVDYLMLKRLAEEQDTQAQEDLRKIHGQLKDMVRRGHRIELHLHPHWIDARYNGDGTWDFGDYTHYSLSSLPDETVTEMFREGAACLNSLARDVVPDYSVSTFRAGGWAVQPFSKLKEGFLAAGIRIDSSSAYGTAGKNQFSAFDFRSIPDKETYRFSDDVAKEDGKGPFLEIPITTYRRTLLNKAANRIHRKTSSKARVIADGTHRRADLIAMPIKGKAYSMLTLSRISPLNALIPALLCRKRLLVFIDHPKDFTYSAITALRWLSRHFSFTTYYKISGQ